MLRAILLFLFMVRFSYAEIPKGLILEPGLKMDSGHVLQVTSEKLDEATAKKLLKNRLIQLKLLFAPRSAPYPGMVTKDEGCRATAIFADKIQSRPQSLYWFSEMPAAEDFSYGNCGNRKEIFWSQYLLLFCKKQQVLYDIRYFSPKTDKAFKFGHPLAACKTPAA